MECGKGYREGRPQRSDVHSLHTQNGQTHRSVEHEEPASVGIHAVECYSSTKLLTLSLWCKLRAVSLLHYKV